MTTLFDDILQMPVETVRDVDAIIDTLLYLQSQFAALAPKSGEWPEWAQWYTIDANGDSYWWSVKPSLSGGIWFARGNRYYRDATNISIPLGIDWRLCKWQRPAVQ